MFFKVFLSGVVLIMGLFFSLSILVGKVVEKLFVVRIGLILCMWNVFKKRISEILEWFCVVRENFFGRFMYL